MSPYFWPNSLTNKQIRINYLILMITLLVYYSHFTDEGSGPTEISTFMYCVAEFRFFCLTVNYKIKPGNPKGNQPWIFIGRTDAEAEAPVLWIGCKELTHWKRLWHWERLKAGGEGEDREWDGWMASPTRWRWVEQAPRVGDGQGSLAWCSSWGRKELDTTECLNWLPFSDRMDSLASSTEPGT